MKCKLCGKEMLKNKNFNRNETLPYCDMEDAEIEEYSCNNCNHSIVKATNEKVSMIWKKIRRK